MMAELSMLKRYIRMTDDGWQQGWHERNGGMYHALIVDDELPALRFVRSIIEQFASGFEVVGTATSGEQGLELLGQQKVDLIITDISMHGISGLDLAQQARRIQPGIHIIIISGYSEFEYAKSAIQVGVDEDERIDEIQEDHSFASDASTHIGLINTCLRLHDYSKGAMRMSIRNEDGAVVELTMPID